MADNYLEKKMEDYRRGAAPRTARGAAAVQQGKITLDFPRRIVLVCAPRPEEAPVAGIVRALVGAGSKVALLCPGADYKAGQHAAQTLGARFLPLAADAAIAETERAWGRPDTYIATVDNPGVRGAFLSAAEPGKARAIYLGEAAAPSAGFSDALAENIVMASCADPVQTCLMLLLPAAAPLAAMRF